VVMKYQKDPLVIMVSLLGFAAILAAQRLFMITHTDSDGLMHMDMDMADAETGMARGPDNKMPDDMDM